MPIKLPNFLHLCVIPLMNTVNRSFISKTALKQNCAACPYKLFPYLYLVLTDNNCSSSFESLLLQSVTELHDGSALFVTVAKYLSPALHDIDQVGIIPDVQCTTEMLNSAKESMFKDKKSVSSLEADSCIMVAEHELDVQESKGTAS